MSAIASALIGALVGAMASSWMYVRHEKKQLKFDALRRYVAHRYDTTSPEFSAVLNEIPLMFADHPEVLRAVDDVRAGSSAARLVCLFRAMATAVGVKHENLSDEQFTIAFNVPKRLPRE